MNIDNLDFVYIIKPGEKGTELRYSLRSIAKWYPNHKIWIVGYKPIWVQDVGYLPVEQTGSKWSNSVNNIIQACKCEDISEEFILMNDDFICIKPKIPLEDIIDSNHGLLSNIAFRYIRLKKSKNSWAGGFIHAYQLLHDLNIEEPWYNYELHLPLRINKKKFLEVISLPEIQEFMKTKKVLHKRTIYKNYDKPEKSITLPHDVKVTKKKDTSLDLLKICGWLSTSDGILFNYKFSNLNNIIRNNLSEPCKYEKRIIGASIARPIPRPITKSKFNWTKFSQ